MMTPLGVYLAGEANGGDGNFWSTWAYGGLGVLTAGSVLGYELSSSSEYDTYPTAGKTSLSKRDLLLAPTVTTTPDQRGASLGLIGAF